MNETLEKIAQAIFKHWFIDFEFPNKEGKPYKSSGGELVETEFGKLPKSWKYDQLNDHIKFIKGKKPKITSNESFENSLPEILIETFDTNNYKYADTNGMVIANSNDILMVMDGASSGRTEIGHSGVVGSTIAKIDLLTLKNAHFYFYYFLKTKQDDIMGNKTGTSIPHADKGKILQYIVPIPTTNILSSFLSISVIIKKMISNNSGQVSILTSIRDSLLPKLMSGKIRVPIR